MCDRRVNISHKKTAVSTSTWLMNFRFCLVFLGTTAINVTSTSSGTVTSVITTGPDGTSIDEGSQQSTLSNASAGEYFSHANHRACTKNSSQNNKNENCTNALKIFWKLVASGEDPAFTPKSRKDIIGGYHSHPATPQSTVPSPGAASINSIHEEYPDINSPSWPRTPASPVSWSLAKLIKNIPLENDDFIYFSKTVFISYASSNIHRYFSSRFSLYRKRVKQKKVLQKSCSLNLKTFFLTNFSKLLFRRTQKQTLLFETIIGNL